MNNPTAKKRQAPAGGTILIAVFAIVLIVAAVILVAPALMFGAALWRLELP